jgi:hypothetical protein
MSTFEEYAISQSWAMPVIKSTEHDTDQLNNAFAGLRDGK